eukprot:scaffold17047_cov83-Cylindrotheca_fusiformis.AAC.2
MVPPYGMILGLKVQERFASNLTSRKTLISMNFERIWIPKKTNICLVCCWNIRTDTVIAMFHQGKEATTIENEFI